MAVLVFSLRSFASFRCFFFAAVAVAFICVSQKGHTNVVKLLVEEHGATVDARDRAYCTSLHAASEGGHGDMVALLLRLGAQIDARNGKHQTPLHYACGCVL